MNHLEILAKNKFESYCRKNSNTAYNWYYLPKARRVAWMSEILDAYQFVIGELKSSINTEPFPQAINTSYVIGRLAGINEERTKYLNQLIALSDNLNSEFDDYVRGAD